MQFRWLIQGTDADNSLALLMHDPTTGADIYVVLQSSPDGVVWTTVPVSAGP